MKIILTGGFLGSGKSTAIQQACKVLVENGKKVGVITNDQGLHLVDTAFIGNDKVPAVEVTGGCFCCRFDELDNKIQEFIEIYQPDILFAESVGSCTDLVATVVKPLQRIYPELEISLSVFADAVVLPKLIKGSRLFVDGVQYIYRKQLEEAGIIVVNKVDMLNAAAYYEVKELVRKQYPSSKILFQNSLDTKSIIQWLDALNDSCEGAGTQLDLDYDKYAAGEAALGWYDAQVTIHCEEEKMIKNVNELVALIYKKITRDHLPIGHLKFLVQEGHKKHKISFTAGRVNDEQMEWENLRNGELTILINARVQTSPLKLQEIIQGCIRELQNQTGCLIEVGQEACFQPGYPKPVHRVLE